MIKDGYKFYENYDGLFRVKDGVVERYEDVDLWVANDEYSEGLLDMDAAFDYNATDTIDDEETLTEYIDCCNYVYSKKGSGNINKKDMICFKFGTIDFLKRIYN